MTTLVHPSNGSALSAYLSEIRKIPLLDKDQEYMLAKRWKEHRDPAAAHRLVTSHLRLSASIAMKYRGYGLPVSDLISEGNLGLMNAVKRFDPDIGVRLATYAMWWIRAAIQEFILRSWSLVKIGTTAAQKKLFFGLRRARAEIFALSEADLTPEQAREIASRLGVREDEVITMDRRLAGEDLSLNSPVRADSDLELLDVLEDKAAVSPEMRLAELEEHAARSKLLTQALKELTERERHILVERRLKDPPTLLEDLARQYGLSRERIRQIEVRAYQKVRAYMLERDVSQPRGAAQASSGQWLSSCSTARRPVHYAGRPTRDATIECEQ